MLDKELAEPVLKTKGVELPALTGLRGLAATWVAFGHIFDIAHVSPKDYWFILPISTTPGLPVSLFYVLSGFIMMHVYGQGNFMQKKFWYAHFLGARFARIYPAYLTALLLLVIPGYLGKLSGHFVGEKMVWDVVLANVLMIQDWGINRVNILLPGWSISVEWFAYCAVFPWALVIYLMLRHSRQFLIGALICIGFSAFVDSYLPWHVRGVHLLLGVACKFVLGTMVYGLFESYKKQIQRLGFFGDVIFMLLGMGLFIRCFYFQLPDWIFTVVFAILILIMAVGNTPIARFLTWSPIYGLGIISYSLYTIHDVVIHVGYHIFGVDRAFKYGPLAVLIYSTISLMISIISAAILYKLVEHPFRNTIRKRIDIVLNQIS